jgi:hypothetical protein
MTAHQVPPDQKKENAKNKPFKLSKMVSSLRFSLPKKIKNIYYSAT